MQGSGWQINERPSLKIYRNWRKEIGGQEETYNNDQASEILFRSRTNNLRLNDRKRFWNEATTCDMCGAEREDLKHLMLWCPAYTQERRKSERLQQPYPEDDDVNGHYLFENKFIEKTNKKNITYILENTRKEDEGERRKWKSQPVKTVETEKKQPMKTEKRPSQWE